jgi:alpha-tubulin suppressor-like RCC1 family protein
MARVRVQSVAAGDYHSFALSWDGRVYSWGFSFHRQLGHGDTLDRPVPALVEGLQNVRSLIALAACSYAVTQRGDVFHWGRAILADSTASSQHGNSVLPVLVEGFGAVRVRRVCSRGSCYGGNVAFAVGEDGELFSWGDDEHGLLGHRDRQSRATPKRVEALRSVRVSSTSGGWLHMLVLTEDGLV